MATFEDHVTRAVSRSDTILPTLEALCAGSGGRPAGSPAERHAAAFLVDACDRAGMNTSLVEFALPYWKRGSEELALDDSVEICLASPGTPACDISAAVIPAGDGEAEDFARVAERAKGAIVAVHSRGSHRWEKYLRAVQAGCAAFLFSNTEAGAGALTGSLSGGALPAAGISFETMLSIEQRVAEGVPPQGRLTISCESSPGFGRNVVAELPGAGDGRTILLCAHYDGHDIAEAALDNASGVALVLEVARALAQQPSRPPSCVRFAFWSGEEIGILGSDSYASTHVNELAVVINCDVVGGSAALHLAVAGADTGRLAELATDVARVSEDAKVVDQMAPYSDHYPFFARGCAVVVAQTPDAFARGTHTVRDTRDKVNVARIRSNAMTVARLVARLSASPDHLPTRHASGAEVVAALRATGVEAALRAQGRWPEIDDA